MEQTTGTPEPLSPLLVAIEKWMSHNGISGPRELARKIGMPEDRVTKWFQRGSGVQLEALPEIERKLDLPLGFFLREAGYVEPVANLIDQIERQPNISEHDKNLLVTLYLAMAGMELRPSKRLAKHSDSA